MKTKMTAVKWAEVKEGDIVYLPTNINTKTPGFCGPFIVRDAQKRILRRKDNFDRSRWFYHIVEELYKEDM